MSGHRGISRNGHQNEPCQKVASLLHPAASLGRTCGRRMFETSYVATSVAYAELEATAGMTDRLAASTRALAFPTARFGDSREEPSIVLNHADSRSEARRVGKRSRGGTSEQGRPMTGTTG